MAGDRIAWHTALLPALQLTFEKYLDALDIQAELPLNREPLRIDGLVIRKDPATVIENPLAKIWRRVNVFEYKSPSVDLRAGEFYKGIVYVFLYASLHKVDVTDMPLSVLAARESSALRRYIMESWRYGVTEPDSGMYRIGGLPFPVQIVELPELSKEQNMFLRSLNAGLDEETVTWAIRASSGPHRMDVSAYLDVITRANKSLLKEMLMRNPALEEILEEIIEESGLAARWEKRAEEKGRHEWEERGRREEKTQIAQNLIKLGLDSKKVADTTGLDIGTVESLCREPEAHP